MSNGPVRQQEEWKQEIQRETAVGQYPKWPNEAMLKLIFGGKNYLAELVNPRPDWRVLDVGCGFGNNLVPFADILAATATASIFMRRWPQSHRR